MCLGMFMAVLDIQIVASSLPDIQTAFGIPLDLLSWVQTAYLIAEIIAIPLTARLTRLLSLRGLFVFAISGFTLASLGAALSPSFSLLLLFRMIQGFCGGAIIPAVFTAGFALFPPDRRVLPTTVAGIFAMVAPTLGPVVGGYITDTYSWHWMFLINLPPGLLVAVLTGALLRGDRPDWPFLRQLDYAGAALAALFLGSFVLFLKEAPKHHWTGGYVSMLAFVCVASGIGAVHRCLTHPEPIVELSALPPARLRRQLPLQLHSRRRPLRLGLSDAGVPRAGARPHAHRDRPRHDRERGGAARWRHRWQPSRRSA